jgi:hypothetical protein
VSYLKFTEIKDTGKTKVWEVTNSNDGSYLGRVKWHGPWRKYVLAISQYCVPAIWSADCLEAVGTFIEERMLERKRDGQATRTERIR